MESYKRQVGVFNSPRLHHRGVVRTPQGNLYEHPWGSGYLFDRRWVRATQSALKQADKIKDSGNLERGYCCFIFYALIPCSICRKNNNVFGDNLTND